ncbi:MAG: hypothetical protein KR126chlam6_01328 [Candidatus Anoxychlamydiales bacterium]|nr:hypothetical protein [Candidatus Anoxychlamydiales bacterium]
MTNLNKFSFDASNSTLIHQNATTKIKVLSSQDSTLFKLQKKVRMLFGKTAITLNVTYFKGTSFEKREMTFLVTKEAANDIRARIAMDSIYAKNGEESFLRFSENERTFVPFNPA